MSTEYQMLHELLDAEKVKLFIVQFNVHFILLCMCNLFCKNIFKKHMVATVSSIYIYF